MTGSAHTVLASHFTQTERHRGSTKQQFHCLQCSPRSGTLTMALLEGGTGGVLIEASAVIVVRGELYLP